MSRSYKKTPYAGDTKGKDKKRVANSKVRMTLKNLNQELKHNDYKKIYDSWDICDYGEIYSWKEYWSHVLKRYIENPNLYKKPPNKKEEYRQWYKWYKMK